MHGFVLVWRGLMRKGDRCVAFSWGKFWSYVPCHLGRPGEFVRNAQANQQNEMLSFANILRRLNSIRVTCCTASLYVVDFKCAPILTRHRNICVP
jgi:hypothetical protein